jgi:hypothetical protein
VGYSYGYFIGRDLLRTLVGSPAMSASHLGPPDNGHPVDGLVRLLSVKRPHLAHVVEVLNRLVPQEVLRNIYLSTMAVNWAAIFSTSETIITAFCIYFPRPRKPTNYAFIETFNTRAPSASMHCACRWLLRAVESKNLNVNRTKISPAQDSTT